MKTVHKAFALTVSLSLLAQTNAQVEQWLINNATQNLINNNTALNGTPNRVVYKGNL